MSACVNDHLSLLPRWYVAVCAVRRRVCAAAPSRPRARRCAQEIYKDQGSFQALETLWRLPFLYLAVLGVRGVCILLLNPLFKLAGTGASARARAARRAARALRRAARQHPASQRAGPPALKACGACQPVLADSGGSGGALSPGPCARAAMSWSEIVFTTVGGLRGAISLILVQQVVTESSPGQEDQKVNAAARAPGRPCYAAAACCPEHVHVCCRFATALEAERRRPSRLRQSEA